MAAAATDKFQKVAIATATTLDAPGYTISDTSITVASTSTWPTDTGITFAIDEVDANGDRVANSYNEYVGVVASGTSVTNVSHVNGTDRNYSAGATTRVYIPVSEERENRLVDGILADHSQAGAHEIASNFDPSNPTLETQKWVGVASAVNEITTTNAITGASPKVSATGDDTNIDLTLIPKGTGTVKTSPVNRVDWTALPLGSVVQVVNAVSSAVATGTTIIPLDDTIPQNTEGDEYMTLAITPKSTANILVIEVIFFGAQSAASNDVAVALFQDSTANALAATSQSAGGTNFRQVIPLTHKMTAGTTSATTFKVRAGPVSAATLTFNGHSAARDFGAVTKSSITITEYKA